MDFHLLLAVAEGCGPGMVPQLLDPHVEPRELLDSPSLLDLPPAVRRRLQDPGLRARAREWRTRAALHRVALLTPVCSDYPGRLRHAPLRPLALFVRGNVDVLRDARRAFTVVGSRTPTPYGEGAARDFCTALASAGLPLWSGLASGVDAAAHRACLDAGTPTVAVVAGGLDSIYPAAHRPLADAIVEAGGAVISEAPPGMRPQRGHFPRRNRILALGAEAVLVVEAGLASGSLHTARFAADAGTPVFAVPGPYTSSRSRGCHRLLEDGAMPASDPEQLLRHLGVVANADVIHLSADAAAILTRLEGGPRPSDLVQRESRLADDRYLAALTELLSAGRVVWLPGDLLAGRATRGRPTDCAAANATERSTPKAASRSR